MFVFKVTNNGSLIANNVVLTVKYITPTGSIYYFHGVPWIFPGVDTAILNIGTLLPGQSYPGHFFYPELLIENTWTGSVTGTVTSSIRDCNPNNNIASSSYSPPQIQLSAFQEESIESSENRPVLVRYPPIDDN